MKRLFKRMPGIVMIAASLLVGCSERNGTDSQSSASGESQATSTLQTFDVGTPEELLTAIGSDRILRLTGKEYVLSDLQDRHMDHVRWDPEFDGMTFTIRNVSNLKLVGKSDEPARIIVRPRYAYVLNFENCTNVTLENLVLGHEPDKGHCTSGVIGATHCEDLKLLRCDLFGCGTEGLTLENVSGFRFDRSIIRECSYGILTIKSCRDLKFTRSQFFENEEYWGFQFHDTRDLLLDDCIIRDNLIKELPDNRSLFHVESCSNIQVRGGSIANNSVRELTNHPDVVQFDKVEDFRSTR